MKPTAVAAAAATFDCDPIRKIPREKFRTKINAPRARENQCINSICPHLGKYMYYDQKKMQQKSENGLAKLKLP